ncbi:PRP21 [Candida pseudojiufengensis]|uniref:PRP21 n=1 Tax=Candida pseudojiufengensis TaxID=497109 RepID=UPI0022255041|nr:PRP21 [Candida pseudojiufengensis]KAI5965796.1 PRP21 [Candida pseudojiufengensis]
MSETVPTTTINIDSSNNIIEPPKDIKETIDKTITYVIKNGKSFEERLLKNDSSKNGNNQFTFLKKESPYHLYYLNKLKLASESKGDESSNSNEVKNVEEEDEEISKPDELKFLIDKFPENLTTKDLKIIKITALYLSINSKPESQDTQIKNLLNHENKQNKSAQFEFLKSSHSLNPIFKIYLNQYRLVNEMFKNKESSEEYQNFQKKVQSQQDNKFNLLIQSLNRSIYLKQHHQKHKNDEKLKQQKLIQFASINWQDFTVLSCVNFNKIDDVKELNLPIDRDSLIKRSLTSKTHDLKLKTATAKPKVQSESEKTDTKENKDKKDADSGKEESLEPAEVSKPIPKAMKGMKIKAAGSTRLKKQKNSSSNFSITSTSQPSKSSTTDKIKCPITGKLIPQNEFDKHLKTILRDPSYKKQQENYLKKNFSYESNISTDKVFENIKRLIKKRNFDDLDDNSE